MKRFILFFLLIMLSLAFAGCQQRAKEQQITMGESSEEAEITSGLDEMEELNSLEEDFDLGLEELDAMNYK